MSLLGNDINTTDQGPVSVWITSLNWFALPVLLRTFLKHGRFQLRFTAATQSGLVLAHILREVRVLSSQAQPVEFTLHGMRNDDPQSPRLLIQGWLPNQFTEWFFQTHKSVLDRFVYPDHRVRRDRVLINLRKAAAQTAADLLAFLELARYRHQTAGERVRRLVIVSPNAQLASGILREWVGDDVEFVCPWSSHNSLLLRLGRSILRCVTDSVRRPKTQAKMPPSIAAAAAWGVDPSARLNDIFWWWNSGIPGERTILFFERAGTPAGRDLVAQLKQWGIHCVVLDPRAAANSPELLWRPSPGIRIAVARLWRAFRVFAWGAWGGSTRCWIARQGLDMMHSSDRMEDFLVDFNVRGLVHHQDGGLDYLSLACDAAGAARIGHHWSYFPWPETAVARLHQVYFVWGPYQARMLEATGSGVDHVLVSGCTVRGAYPGSANALNSASLRSTVAAHGATRVLALFDTSLPCEGLYEFFLRRTVEDPRWGLLIKPKNSHLPWLRYHRPELAALYQQAVSTGRVSLLDSKISPTEAAAAADISVAVDINSAAVVAALAGHRAIHLDYVRVHASPLADWATLYRAGPDRLVFDDPDKLWEQLNRFFEDPESLPTLGQASEEILGDIDPFRDGRAGERIGEYIRWYLEALDSGLEREPALEQASSHYAAKWGPQSVVRGLSRRSTPTVPQRNEAIA